MVCWNSNSYFTCENSKNKFWNNSRNKCEYEFNQSFSTNHLPMEIFWKNIWKTKKNIFNPDHYLNFRAQSLGWNYCVLYKCWPQNEENRVMSVSNQRFDLNFVTVIAVIKSVPNFQAQNQIYVQQTTTFHSNKDN